MIEYTREIRDNQDDCPKCGSCNLIWGAIEFEEEMDSIYYPVRCEDCTLEYKEWFNIVYDATEFETNKTAKDD